MKHVSAAELVAPDPLLHNVALPLQATFYPIGFPVELHTNNVDVLAAAHESWGANEQKFSKPPIRLKVAVSDNGQHALPPSPVFRAQEHLLSIVSDAENFATCDLSAGFSFCWLTRAAASARAWTRHFFLDAIVYTTLTHRCVTPVHAACVTKNGRGVLLCGPSGMGKSVLALTSARSGWHFVTDDVGYLLREAQSTIVIGKPERMKFLPSAAPLFPDVSWTQTGLDHAGQPFVELRTADLEVSTAQSCLAEYLVFLRRTPGAARFLPIDRYDAFARLLMESPLYEKSVHQAHRDSLEALSRLHAFELQYHHLPDAIGLLNRLVGADTCS